MKPEALFPFSQGPVMCTFPESDESTTLLYILILFIPPRLSLPFRFPTKLLHVFLFPQLTPPIRTTCLAYLILICIILTTCPSFVTTVSQLKFVIFFGETFKGSEVL